MTTEDFAWLLLTDRKLKHFKLYDNGQLSKENFATLFIITQLYQHLEELKNTSFH